jgi:hypothetical protein
LTYLVGNQKHKAKVRLKSKNYGYSWNYFPI